VVAATGTTLVGIFGIGPVGAGRILAEVGMVAQIPDKDHFASYQGTAPIEASSGEQQSHRLSREGRPARQPSAAHGGGYAAPLRRQHRPHYYTGQEALSCLKLRLSDVVYRQLALDLTRTEPSANTRADLEERI
jgi:transposase